MVCRACATRVCVKYPGSGSLVTSIFGNSRRLQKIMLWGRNALSVLPTRCVLRARLSMVGRGAICLWRVHLRPSLIQQEDPKMGVMRVLTMDEMTLVSGGYNYGSQLLIWDGDQPNDDRWPPPIPGPSPSPGPGAPPGMPPAPSEQETQRAQEALERERIRLQSIDFTVKGQAKNTDGKREESIEASLTIKWGPGN